MNNSDCVVFGLDDYVERSDGRGDCIFCQKTSPFIDYQLGDTIEVDIDETKDREWSNYIATNTIVRKIYPNQIIRSNNNNLINQNQQGTAIQMLNRAIDSDPRNKYTASMEVDPKTGKVFYHLSGERK